MPTLPENISSDELGHRGHHNLIHTRYNASVDILSGTLAARPAAGTAGRLYFTTDTQELFRDTGSTWDEYVSASVINHILAGADHTASGLTAGQVLRATGASTFAWQAIADADVPSTITRDTEAVLQTLADAKGDLIAATAADTFARKAIGSEGQVLVARAAQATGIAWETPSSGGASLTDATIRYVDEGGNDSNDGSTWSLAKRTVKSAVAALPTRTVGTATWNYGTVYIGPGTYTEAASIGIGDSIRFIGIGSTSLGTAHGSRIVRSAGTGSNPLFSPVANFDAEDVWMHDVVFKNLYISGGGGAGDLIQLRRPGFGTYMMNVNLESTTGAGVGIYIFPQCETLWLYEVDAFGLDGGFIHLNHSTQAAGFAIFGSQIDRCGKNTGGSVFKITTSAGLAQQTAITIVGVTVEGNYVAPASGGWGDYLVYHNPSGGTSGPKITMMGITSWGCVGTAMFYEANGSGVAADVVMINCDSAGAGSGYTNLYKSDKRVKTVALARYAMAATGAYKQLDL